MTQQALELLRQWQPQQVDAEAIKRFLLQHGLEPRVVDELLEQISLAFCRAAYRFREPPGSLESVAELPDSPLYRQAYRLASDCNANETMNTGVFNCLVQMSPEYSLFRAGKGRK